MTKLEYQATKTLLKSVLRWHKRRINEIEIRLSKLDELASEAPKHWPLQLTNK